MKILHIVGARPNFMKMAPVAEALRETGRGRQFIVHTGQHYDRNMSGVFFSQLGIPEPDVNLEVGPGTSTQQTAQCMLRLEPVIREEGPDMALVYGDVNSTLAGALVCARLGVRLGHVEAGLRSFDPDMPEELNRVLTDRMADLLFTPSRDGDENLIREGISREKIHFVGNVMIDTLVRLREKARTCDVLKNLGLPKEKKYVLATLHRPSNVDDPENLARLLESLKEISSQYPVVFPMHPRTRKCLGAEGPAKGASGLFVTEPLGYLEFLCLLENALAVITDSGGIQEETTFLGVPCLTVRKNTERPVTISQGTNTLVGAAPEGLADKTLEKIREKGIKGKIPPLWDGKAGARIAGIINDRLSRP